MAIGDKFRVKLTPAEARAVKEAIDKWGEASLSMATALALIQNVKPVAVECGKLQRTADGLHAERVMLNTRLIELLDNGRRHGGCHGCGCTAPPVGKACEYCKEQGAAA